MVEHTKPAKEAGRGTTWRPWREAQHSRSVGTTSQTFHCHGRHYPPAMPCVPRAELGSPQPSLMQVPWEANSTL